MSTSFHLLVAAATGALVLSHPVQNVSSHIDMSDSHNSSACNDINHCRTMGEIVWGCVTTVSLCTWASFHPEVPDLRFTKWRAAVVQIIAVCMSFVFPELVVSKAVNQWVEVQRYKSVPPFPGWTESHSFLAIMGGFVNKRDILDFQTIRMQPIEYAPGLFRQTTNPLSTSFEIGGVVEPSASSDGVDDDSIAQRTGQHSSTLPLVTKVSTKTESRPGGPAASSDPPASHPSLPLSSLRRLQQWLLGGPFALASTLEDRSKVLEIFISKDDILDKSKSNGIAKFLVLAQTTWFVLQIIERWAAHQTRTQLEIMTLAYAILNIIIYALWWNKPLNVNEPIQVLIDRDWVPPPIEKIGVWSSHQSLLQDARVALYEDHGGGNVSPLQIAAFLIIGILFGGVHCFAWWFQFPTSLEATMWRACAIYCTAAPVPLAFLLVNGVGDGGGVLTSGFLASIISLAYVGCRVILLVLTLACFRASPPGIYHATTWTRLLPHIG